MRLPPARLARGADGDGRRDLADRGRDYRRPEHDRRSATLGHRCPGRLSPGGSPLDGLRPGAPLVVYALARLGALGTRHARMAAAIACLPFVAPMVTRVQNMPVLALALAICGLAALLALRTVQEEVVRRGLHVVRDDLREKVLTCRTRTPSCSRPRTTSCAPPPCRTHPHRPRDPRRRRPSPHPPPVAGQGPPGRPP